MASTVSPLPLQMLCLAEGLQPCRNELLALIAAFGHDMRRVFTALQLAVVIAREVCALMA